MIAKAKNYIDYKDVVIRPLPNRKYQLINPIKVDDKIIPPGYITNGANIPRMFWWLIEPNQSDIMPAIILHDYLCDVADGTIKATPITFRDADVALKNNLYKLNQRKWKIYLIYGGVRTYHYIRYESCLSKIFKRK